MVTIKKSFSRKNKLTNRRLIAELFKKGKCLKIFPYKVFYLKTKKKSAFFNNQVLFSVSKGYVRSAVRRNQIKRLGREAYRLHMHMLQEVLDDDVAFLIGFVYTGPCSLVVCNNTLTNAIVTSLQHLKVFASM